MNVRALLDRVHLHVNKCKLKHDQYVLTPSLDWLRWKLNVLDICLKILPVWLCGTINDRVFQNPTPVTMWYKSGDRGSRLKPFVATN